MKDRRFEEITIPFLAFAEYSIYYTDLQYTTQVAVAPRAGAWIETSQVILLQMVFKSHPVRVRGLKLLRSQAYL